MDKSGTGLNHTTPAEPPRHRVRAYQKHGAYTLRAQLKERGNKPIDGRSSDAQWRKAMADDLGGWDALPRWKREILEQATRTRAIINRIDQWLLGESADIVNKRSRKLHAVVKDRAGLVETLIRLLGLLGAKGSAAPSGEPDLASYLAGKGGAHGG